MIPSKRRDAVPRRVPETEKPREENEPGEVEPDKREEDMTGEIEGSLDLEERDELN